MRPAEGRHMSCSTYVGRASMMVRKYDGVQVWWSCKYDGRASMMVRKYQWTFWFGLLLAIIHFPPTGSYEENLTGKAMCRLVKSRYKFGIQSTLDHTCVLPHSHTNAFA